MEDQGILKCYFVTGKALFLLCFLPLTIASFETPTPTFLADNILSEVSGGDSHKVKALLSGIFGISY